MLGQKDGNPYVSAQGRDVQFNILEMMRQYEGNAYLPPQGRGSTIPQAENPSHILPQGRVPLSIATSTSGMNYGAIVSFMSFKQ